MVIALASPAPGRPVTSPYGWRKHPITGQRKLHAGIDFGGSFTVLSAGSGTVVKTGYSATGYGHYVIVQHDPSLRTLYAHGKTASKLRVGDSVRAGTTVFTSGSTGASTGNHLHFEVRVKNRVGVWAAVDPAPYLTAKPSTARRKNTMATLYYTKKDNKNVFALAGEAPGTSANWLETSDQTFANQLAAQHGPAAYLTPASFDGWKQRYLEPVKTLGNTSTAAPEYVLTGTLTPKK